MCANLTAQVRSIAGVTTAVAKVRRTPLFFFDSCRELEADPSCSLWDEQGDLTMTIDIEVEGEMATLKETVSSIPPSEERKTSRADLAFRFVP